MATFEQHWSDEREGRTLPRFVMDELRGFLSCGVLARGFAHLYCDTCRERHLVAFCCKGRGFCPSCLGRRMNEGAANLVDHVLPEVPIRQWVLTMPHPLRFPLAFEGRLLAAVLRIFIDTVSAWYRERQKRRRLGGGRSGAVAVIQRGSSDLRLNPHFHVLFLDGLCVCPHSPSYADFRIMLSRPRSRRL
ncbi:MAG: transposase zinc-binding domain-containing protein, partial [Myxococcales bacterium]